MKKFSILAFFIISLTYICAAQPPNRAARIEALKVAYITRVLSLTTEEAQKFWPVYNNYTAEIKQTKAANKDDELKFEEAVLNVKKKYKPEFKKVLGDDARVNTVFQVDKNFNGLLRKELQKRQQANQPQP